MNSPAPRSPRSRSQAGGRRPTRPPSHLHSDCPPETEDSPSLGQRSASLTTLQPTIIQPRMAQLETLEAKMASIEVSLSSTPRRKKNGSINGNLTSSIRSIPKEIAVKELESLRNALRDKENIIQSLKGQLTIPGLRLSHIRNGGVCNNNNSTVNNRELSEVEKKQAEERLSRLRNDTDNKRLAIKNLKMALERLDITDNIDVRIQQAELEYQLGREELNLLTLLEETRALQLCLEECNKSSSDFNTLYSCVHGDELISLHAIEIVYDPKSPRFGAGQKDSSLGLWIDWALEDTGICKGDRLIEVNGKIVLTKTRDDLARLLAAAPDPAQIVVLRKNFANTKNSTIAQTSTNGAAREVAALRSELEVVRERAEEAQRAKDGLRSDNIRLTHRISYLEEQVSELLSRKNSESDIRIVTQSPVITSTVKTSQNVTNINISSQPTAVVNNSGNDLQVFQKGPQVTALVANLPGLEVSKDNHTSLPVRSKSSLSNVSNTHIPAPSPQSSDNHSCHKNHRHKHRNSRNSLQFTGSAQGLDQNYKKHHHHHHMNGRDRDYNSETNSTVEQRPRRIENGHRIGDCNKVRTEKEYQDASLMEQSYKKATKIVHDLTKHKENSLYEKHRQKCLTASEKYNADILKHYNARKSTSVLDFRSEVHIGPKYDSRSIDTLDGIDTTTANGKRLYKKLHDARSVKSLDFDSDCNSNTYRNPNVPNSIDYTSEPIDANKKLVHYHNLYNDKPRPTPPKKPIRLSLHRAQSVQSVETPAETPASSPDKHDPRKPIKRNYKGEVPPVSLLTVKVEKSPDRRHNGSARIDDSHFLNNGKNGQSEMKWSSFGQVHKHENGHIRVVENGSWC